MAHLAAAPLGGDGSGFLLEKICVDLDVLGPFGGQVILGEDRLDGTLIDTESAVDACVGVDVELCALRKLLTLLCWVNAVNGTNFNARGVLGTDAGFSNDVRHDGSG